MPEWEVMATVKGPARTITTPATPPTVEADTINDVLKFLGENAQFPDNAWVKTISVTVKLAGSEVSHATDSSSDSGILCREVE